VSVEKELYPLVIYNSENAVVEAALINKKGYTKSLENNVLWVVHPETGRLLPFRDGPELVRLVFHNSWYEAYIVLEKPGSAAGNGAGTRDSDQDTADRATAETKTGAEGDVLVRLGNVIRDRKRSRAEGSYTTYLFNEGLEKIRKKTGEEAIELILAQNEHETVHEAADLIYHMLVLLEAENIGFEKVLEELLNRSR
jgi:phosphoribosyl-AMP cyclohydrolase / phosphoribosyl-ATP pyrophosphohydrolase